MLTRALNWHHVKVVTSDSPYWIGTPAMHQSVDKVGVYGCGGVFRKPVLFFKLPNANNRSVTVQ
jgi:hypothetical protein